MHQHVQSSFLRASTTTSPIHGINGEKRNTKSWDRFRAEKVSTDQGMTFADFFIKKGQSAPYTVFSEKRDGTSGHKVAITPMNDRNYIERSAPDIVFSKTDLLDVKKRLGQISHINAKQAQELIGTVLDELDNRKQFSVSPGRACGHDRAHA